MATTPDGALLLRITRDELVAHLTDRIAYHQTRVTDITAKADELDKKLGADLAEANTVSDRIRIKNSSNYVAESNALDALRGRASSHDKRARRLTFYRDHLGTDGDAGAPFYLSANELTRLEFLNDGDGF